MPHLYDWALEDLAWWDKKACRVEEALWLGIHPREAVESISKFSKPIDPFDVVDQGNKTLHATDGPLKYGSCNIACIDSVLVSVGKPSLLNFTNKYGSDSEGV